MSIKVEWMRTLAVADATRTIFLCWIRAQICLEQICLNPKGDRQDSLPSLIRACIDSGELEENLCPNEELLPFLAGSSGFPSPSNQSVLLCRVKLVLRASNCQCDTRQVKLPPAKPGAYYC
jgi:hypothetical protein